MNTASSRFSAVIGMPAVELALYHWGEFCKAIEGFTPAVDRWHIVGTYSPSDQLDGWPRGCRINGVRGSSPETLVFAGTLIEGGGPRPWSVMLQRQ